jgi:hypothetical protein
MFSACDEIPSESNDTAQTEDSGNTQDNTVSISSETDVFGDGLSLSDEELESAGVNDAEYDARATSTNFFSFTYYGKASNYCYIITGWSSYAVDRPTEVVFPNVYSGRPVVGIKQEAFMKDSTITSIEFGPNMKIIGKRSFWENTSLATVTIPIVEKFVSALDPETYVDGASGDAYTADLAQKSSPIIMAFYQIEQALHHCASLTSFEYPTYTLVVMNGLFRNCTSLTSVTFQNTLTTIASMAFQGCTSLEEFNGSALTKLTAIGSATFKGCTSLEEVRLGSKITSIPTSCFAGCTSLSTFVATGKISKVGLSAFYNCSTLSSVTLTSDAVIQVNAFYNCPAGEAYGA